MRRRCPLFVLAVLAALLGAPSMASGAGNTLTEPVVSPGVGTVETVFTFGVSYDGEFGATAVTVSIAGATHQMQRTTGTALAGAWTVSLTLPAGTWVPTFSATAEGGNVATVTGIPVVVSGPTPAPTPEPTLSGGSPDGPERGTSAPPGTDGEDGTGDQPDVAPAPGDEPGASTDAAPAMSPDASGDSGAEPAAPTPGTTDHPGGGAPAGRGGAGAGSGAAPAAPGPSTAPGTESSPAEAAVAADPAASALADAVPAADRDEGTSAERSIVEDGLLGLVLLVGLSGIAAVAIIGTALLLAGRRRTENDEGADAPMSDMAATEAILERRTLRQAKVRLTQDPIVAAMGIEDAPRRRRRSDTGPTGRGRSGTKRH